MWVYLWDAPLGLIHNLLQVEVPVLFSVAEGFSCGTLSFLNVGGFARCRILEMSMNAFVVSFPYVNLGILCFGLCNISMISEVACFKYVSGIVFGKNIYCGKKSTASTCIVTPVAGM